MQLQKDKSDTPKSEPTTSPIQETMPPQDCLPRVCMSPSRIMSWPGQLVKGLDDNNPTCPQSSAEAVCSTQFQNIISIHLNISPQTSLAHMQVISFMIEGWRQSHRTTVPSSCACETPESSRFGNNLSRNFQMTISMPHHPRP